MLFFPLLKKKKNLRLFLPSVFRHQVLPSLQSVLKTIVSSVCFWFFSFSLKFTPSVFLSPQWQCSFQDHSYAKANGFSLVFVILDLKRHLLLQGWWSLYSWIHSHHLVFKKLFSSLSSCLTSHSSSTPLGWFILFSWGCFLNLFIVLLSQRSALSPFVFFIPIHFLGNPIWSPI